MPRPTKSDSTRTGRDLVPAVSEDLFAEIRLLKRAAAVLHQRVKGRHADFVAQIRSSADSLESALGTLRSFGASEPGRPGRLELHAVAERVVSEYRVSAASAGLRFSYRAAGEPVWVNADESLLIEALAAIVSNAIKFTASGSVSVSVESHREAARLVVEDTGCGLSPEDLGRFVRPFTQGSPGNARSHGGLGLGLPLADRAARDLGGSLSLEPYAAGSRIVLSLPRESAPALRRAA